MNGEKLKMTTKDKMDKIVMCYEKQYPDRLANFEKLINFPYKKYLKCRNSNLRKLSKYYEMLINDLDFLVNLIKEKNNE